MLRKEINILFEETGLSKEELIKLILDKKK